MLKTWWRQLFALKNRTRDREKTLIDAGIGERVSILCLRGEEGVCQRLREMGFCESAVIEKVADSGALICKVCNTKLIISKKLAENIIVQDIPSLK